MSATRKIFRKAVSFLMVAVLLLAVAPSALFAVKASATDASLHFGVVSDIHYYAHALMNETPAFEEWAMTGSKQYINQDGILDSAFAVFEKAKDDGLKYIIVPGDLTRNGEYEGNVELSRYLTAFEERTGIQVMVINGNHDINNEDAASFLNGEFAVPSRYTTPEEFRSLYAELGYDLATATFTPKDGTKAGMLSYAVELDGYRLIFMDGGKYSADSTSDGMDEHETAGNYTPELMEWILGQIDEANKKGETVIGVDHWSLVPHYESQETILRGFTLDERLQVSETLADAGMHYVFTGHSHQNDVATHVSDNGETLFDIQTNSMIEFPNYVRTIDFQTDAAGKVKMDYTTHECDEVLPVTDHGVTYEQPYRRTFAFDYTYEGGAKGFAKRMVKPMIMNLFKDIQADGGLVNYIGRYFDLEGFLKQYIGAFTSNAMSFVNDLGKQVDERYINDPEYTLSVLNGIIDQLCDMKVSDYPCMALHDEYGYGDGVTPGTFADVVLVAMIGMWEGNEDISDPFMQDVIDRFENGDLGKQVFNKLYDLIVNQLLQDEILSNLYVNTSTLFQNTGYDQAGGYVQLFTDLLTSIVSKNAGNNIGSMIENILHNYTAANGTDASFVENAGIKGTTYLDLVNSVLLVLDETGVLKGGSVDGALQVVMEEYLTESQYQAWGHTFAVEIQDFGSDTNPEAGVDHTGTFRYTGKVPVTANQDNYRLPSLISVSLGEDGRTTRNLSWYTKYSVTGTDIELIPYSPNAAFSGKNQLPAGVKAETSTALTDRHFPGVDLGVIGIMDNAVHLQRHIIRLSGLKADTEYLYRIGDAKMGWWSETGVLKTADSSDEVTFLHLTDSQGQNEKQYAVFANVLEKALANYDDTDLIIHSGDMVDKGGNLNYWKYFFNASEELKDIPLMPVAGNHEAKDDYALDENFVLPSSVKQDTASGYYYSFDYNNVHFMMLNTNDTDDNGLGAEQLSWLKRDAASSRARWKVVVLHKALYSNGSHFDDKEVEAMRAQLGTLMPQLGIDVVFQGHDHVYLRTGAMNSNQVVAVDTRTKTFDGVSYTVKMDPAGTVYAISGASGCKSYVVKDAAETDALFPRAESVVTAEHPVYSGIRIVGDSLYFDAYTVDGEAVTKIDSFAIEKTKKQGDVDMDGDVDNTDAILVLRAAAKLVTLTQEQLAAADLDGDNHITTEDACEILRLSAGIV